MINGYFYFEIVRNNLNFQIDHMKNYFKNKTSMSARLSIIWKFFYFVQFQFSNNDEVK